MYFYKNSNGAWIVGSTPYSIKTAGLGGMSPSAVNTGTAGNWAKVDIKIGLITLNNQVITAIKKNAAGDTYANFAEFYAAVEPFFIGNGVSKSQVISTADGVADENGVITGTTVFALSPDNNNTLQVFNGGVYETAYVVSGAYGSKIITFTTAPLLNNQVDIFYN